MQMTLVQCFKFSKVLRSSPPHKELLGEPLLRRRLTLLELFRLLRLSRLLLGGSGNGSGRCLVLQLVMMMMML